jgi:hypothetical protein
MPNKRSDAVGRVVRRAAKDAIKRNEARLKKMRAREQSVSDKARVQERLSVEEAFNLRRGRKNK